MPVAFHDVRLPDDVERGAEGGPRFKTLITPLASGHERRSIDWEKVRGSWDVGYGIQSKDTLDPVIAFFYARQGRAHSFRFKNWSDFELPRQDIGITNGSTATYQVFKRYSSGGVNFDKDLTKLVSGTVQVWVNNVPIAEGGGASQFSVNLNTGIVTIGSTLAAQSGTDVEVLCEFDEHVRFDTDELDIQAFLYNVSSAVRIPIIGVRE